MEKPGEQQFEVMTCMNNDTGPTKKAIFFSVKPGLFQSFGMVLGLVFGSFGKTAWLVLVETACYCSH